jgi:uncharacterized protein YjiS (DUF1127 family)
MTTARTHATLATALAARPRLALVAELLLRLAALADRWAERARSRADLARLDEAQLRDIGILRAEAEAEARKPFWRV